ncbi:hypothetical protein [Sporosarcina sp. FSL K6-1508]|uniref:hypothetical protein n=1 Tax=Sporosarcina sp. FSL K6-1508 TaxID=2921553 RepID=UPI0030FA51DA
MTEKVKLMNKMQTVDMRHAIKNGNRFYTDSNNKNWNDLVEKGYATKRPGWDVESAYYIPTTEGKQALEDGDSND